MKKLMTVLNKGSFVFQAVWSAMIYFVIECLSRHSLAEGYTFMVENPLVFLYNVFIIFLTFMPVYLFRRRIFYRVFISAFWFFLGYMNGNILSTRVTPFTGQDLHLITDALAIVNLYMTPVKLILNVVGVLIGIVALVLLWKFAPKYQGTLKYKWNIPLVALVAAAFAGTTKLALDNRILSTYFGNIAFAYEDYGFPYCFSCSLLATGMNKPYDYSNETIQEIIDWEEPDTEEAKTPNIIFVQLESFFDVTTVEDLEFSEDPIPNFRKLMEEYSSGAFKVPSVGAGTANTEFETITGMNLRYFGPGEYPYKTILKKTTCESIPYDLKQIGYTTHAIHNNKATFYSRVDVFPNLGFDTFTSKEYMSVENKTENGWLKDEVLIGAILDDLNSTEGQDYVYAISVQAHGEYPEEKVLEDPVIKVTGAETEGKNNAWEYYTNQIHEVDQFVADLITALEEYGEDTVLVLYGDHLPTMGLSVEDVSNRYLYDTSYVIWDNIGLPKKDQTLCSYQMGAEVLDQLDIHVGTMVQYHQNRRKTKQYLPDMEMLQYDLLYGKRYAYDQQDLFPRTAMTMGPKVPSIRSAVQMDNNVYVFGENFTTASKIYINDEYTATSFINDHTLRLKKVTLSDMDELQVNQLAPGKKRRILSEGGAYIYRAPIPPAVDTEGMEGAGEAPVNTEEGNENDI